MEFRTIGFLFILISLSSIVFSSSVTLGDMGYTDMIFSQNEECREIVYPINIDGDGVLSLDLRINYETNDTSYLKITGSEGSNLMPKNRFGQKYLGLFSNMLQDSRYILVIDSIDSFPIKICSNIRETNNIKISKQSEIGYFDMPNFYCEDCFLKKSESKFRANEKAKMGIEFRNEGSQNAQVDVFYDSRIYTKWSKLRDGVPSFEGTIAPTVSKEIVYNYLPLTESNFIISPAVLSYEYDNYLFKVYSNAILVGATPYFDIVELEYNFDDYRHKLGESAELNIEVYNDSKDAKSAELFVDLGDYELTRNLNLDGFERDIVTFEISSDEEVFYDVIIGLRNIDENSIRVYGKESVGFYEDKFNFVPIFIAMLILISAVTFLYYFHLYR